MSAREFLLDQWARHPASRLQDLQKALYQSTFGCGHLVDDPSAAADWIRREAEHEGIGRAWVVERKWEPSLYKTHLFYLMENERAVMLGDTHLSPLGWETMFGATVDCTGEEPIYAGYHQISHDDKVLGCYFGQINDPAIETVVISIQQEEYDQGKAVRSELRRLTVEQEDFVTGRDRTFFWIMEPLPLEQSPEAVCYPVMIAYDAEGRIAAEFDIECCTYSGYG